MSTSLAPRVTGAAAAIALWVALIAGLSVAGSFAFACAAPLAAVAALAAITMGRADGVALVVAAWLANQIVGFGFLDYPLSANTFAWGGTIGAAALAVFLAARLTQAVRLPALVSVALALPLSFVAYEAVLYAAGLVLGGSDSAFTTEVIQRIFVINAVAFVGLLVLERVAIALSLLKPVPEPSPTAV
jgi:hypothetical protein